MGRKGGQGGAQAVSTGDPLVPAQAGLSRPAVFTTLFLDQLAESPHNPRKHFDPVQLAELAASIAASGIWEPITVRPHASGDGVYEIASGHRRFRAAKVAGLVEVPALVREMTDAEFMEVLTVANLQREDVHPLEEADAYAELMLTLAWDVPTIARKMSKGETYVYDRLKFRTLIPEVRALFFVNRITPAHATELSRITAEQQGRAIDPTGDGVWQPEGFLRDPAQSAFDMVDVTHDPYNGLKLRTVRELRAWIQYHCRFDATAADPILFPDAVQAVAQAAEAEVKVVHITRLHRVHDDAKAEKQRTYGRDAWKRADGQEDPYLDAYSSRGKLKTCEHAVLGVVVAGPGQSDAFPVCIAKDKCKVHWAAEQKAKAATSQKSGADGTPAKAPKEEPWQRAQRLEEEARERFKPAVPAVLEALAAAMKKASLKAGGPVDQLLLRAAQVSDQAKKLMPRGKTAEDLVRHLAFDVVTASLGWNAHTALPKFGKQLGVDVAKIVKAHAAAPASPAAAKPAKGKARA